MFDAAKDASLEVIDSALKMSCKDNGTAFATVTVEVKALGAFKNNQNSPVDIKMPQLFHQLKAKDIQIAPLSCITQRKDGLKKQKFQVIGEMEQDLAYEAFELEACWNMKELVSVKIIGQKIFLGSKVESLYS